MAEWILKGQRDEKPFALFHEWTDYSHSLKKERIRDSERNETDTK